MTWQHTIGATWTSVCVSMSDSEKPIKIDKWDSTALKNALDDAAKKVLVKDLGYHESHVLMDMRLAICTISVLFALFALLWDYLHPFPKSRPILILCVLSYFILMAILTAYTTWKEKGIFAVAYEKDRAGLDPDSKWTISSTLKRYEANYTIVLSRMDGQTKELKEKSDTCSVADFFDEDGTLCTHLYEPFIKKLHSGLVSSKKAQ